MLPEGFNIPGLFRKIAREKLLSTIFNQGQRSLSFYAGCQTGKTAHLHNIQPSPYLYVWII